MKIVISLQNYGNYWVAECINLPGCISQGDSKAEAIENIKEAIQGYIEIAIEDGIPLPDPNNEYETVEV